MKNDIKTKVTKVKDIIVKPVRTKDTIITIFKMRKRWKVLLSVSLILNILIVVAVVNFAKFGKHKTSGIMSGNIYSMYVLSHKGTIQWKHFEKKNGYNIKDDVKAQRNNIVDLKIMLRKGSINKKEFRQKMQQMHKIQHKNYKRFVNEFPEYWNSLTHKQKKKYMKKIRKKEKYHD